MVNGKPGAARVFQVVDNFEPPEATVTGVTSQDGVTRAAFEAHKNRENALFSGLNGPVTS